MYKNVEKQTKIELKDLVSYQEGQVVSKTLVQNDYVSMTIFSFDKGEEISKYLISTSPRGVTIINATGAYSCENKKVLFCALKENELPEFQKKIINIDREAFIVYSESSQIMGNGFHIYR